jgi:hypothetical protein
VVVRRRSSNELHRRERTLMRGALKRGRSYNRSLISPLSTQLRRPLHRVSRGRPEPASGHPLAYWQWPSNIANASVWRSLNST